MGCIWSSENGERCIYCGRRDRNNLIIINHECEICNAVRSRVSRPTTSKPRWGEYHCSCGRVWSSAQSRSNMYQQCSACHTRVYPRNQRDLLPGEQMISKENLKEHRKELCQMCQQLGYHCGAFGKDRRRPKTNGKRY